MSTVYISHSRQDGELARDLARRLRDVGLKPLVESADVSPGADWKKIVREQIRAADAVLFLVTPAALDSAWMMTELGMAEGMERLIVPVSAGIKARDLPAPLRSYVVAPFDQVDKAIDTLSEKLAAAKG